MNSAWKWARARLLPVVVPLVMVVFVRGYVAHADVVPSG